MPKVSALSMVSYDSQFLLRSIPYYLPFVDELILGVDADGLSWSGEPVEISEEFFTALSQIDQYDKIKIVKERFHIPGKSALELDTRERNILSSHASHDGWLVSIDADELMINAKEFFDFLRAWKGAASCMVGNWIVVYKLLGDKVLLVSAQHGGGLEQFPLATLTREAFVTCRWTNEPRVVSPALALHYSWGRSPEELAFKLRNWSHKVDFDVDSYLRLWNALDDKNYKYVRDLHPFQSAVWPSLICVPNANLMNISIDELLPLPEDLPLREILQTLGRKFKKRLS